MNIVTSALGRYEKTRTGDRYDDFDCVIGNSFGTSTHEGSVNHTILAYCQWEAIDVKPLIVDRTLAKVGFSPYGPSRIDHIVEGPVSNTTGGGVGTWGVLTEALAFMRREYGDAKPLRPLLVGQANHTGRITMQARKLGMDPVTDVGMPTEFDRRSDQFWTRNLAFWLPREILGSFILKKKGHL